VRSYRNIQVENPVAILDQEEAKKFLTGKAQDKYAFFMKACELERLDRTFATIVDKLEATRTAKDRVADGMARQQDQVTELKRKYDELIQVEKLQKGLRASEVKCAWATYQVAHVQLVEAQEKKTDFEKKVAKREEELTQAEELSQKSSTGNDQMTKLAAELTAEAQDQAAQKLELEAELKRSAVPFRQQEQKIKALERQERQARKDSQAAQQHLKSAREEIASNSKESEEARLAQNLARAEEELAAVREEEESLRQRVAVALQKYEEIEPSVREAKRKTTDSKGRYRSTKQRLDELEKSTGDTLAMFGPRVKQVKALVESHRRHFRGPVVGPIGAYLKIEEGKEDFAEIAELSLGGGVLDRFIVTNNEDRVTLQKLRLQARCQSDCGIFMVATNPRFRVPKPATALIETAASVLKVESDLVFNCLVDNAKIDQVALARDRVKSELALIENRDGRKVLKGIIKEVYCLPHGDHWILRNGQQAAFSNEKRLKHTIGTDKSAAIAQFKRDIDQLDVDVQEAQREENRLEGEHTAHQRDWNSLKKSHRRSNDRINTLGDQIDQIKIELENTASSNIDTSELEEEVAQQREILAKIATDVERAKVEQGEHQPVIDELRAKIKEIAQRSDKVLNDLSKTEDEMVKVLQTASQHKDGMAKKRAKLDKYLEIMRMHAEKIEGFQEEDDRSLHTARTLQYRLQTVQNAADEGSDKPVAMSPSPDVGVPSEELEKIEPPEGELKDPKYYLAKIERQKEKIKSVRRRQRLSDEDPAEALSRYLKAQEDFKRKMDDIDDLGETIHRYEQDLRGRRRKWHGYRDYLTKVTSNKFSELLGLNRYAGTLDFKHDEGELNLQVQKNDNNGASTSSDVKGLR
jgi:chromosome segregation ATPase